ncbi:hypothetical protein HK101_009033 [Irineochytrium annulatum]|nr:hypothetical protein HK101_009033 [Irineochytrium annulatum]
MDVVTAVTLPVLQAVLAALPVLAIVDPKPLHKRGWAATAVGMIGTELTSLTAALHVLAYYVTYRAGGLALLPKAVYQPLTSLVVALHLAVFVHGLVNGYSVAKSALESLRKQLPTTTAPDDKKATVDAPVPPSYSNISLLFQALHPLYQPWNVTTQYDITYATPDEVREAGGSEVERFMQLDVIRKDSGYKNRPVFLYIHGGAWAFGDKSKMPAALTLPLCWHMASSANWVVCNVNYRMLPRFKLADMVTDLKRVVRWIKENADVHGGDPKYIVVSGGSAGGHLAALLALHEPSLKTMVGFYPVTHPLDERLPGFSNWVSKVLIGGQRPAGKVDAGDSWADPMLMLRARSADQVPTQLVLHGANDSLVSVNSVREYVAELRNKKVVTAYCEFPYAHHGFDVFSGPRSIYSCWFVGAALEMIYESELLKKKD